MLRYSIVIFAGNPALTRTHLLSLQSSLDDPNSFINTFSSSVFRFVTITSVAGNGGQEVLGLVPFGQEKGRGKGKGKLYFDPLVQAHEIYGVDPCVGAVVVFRPDGWIGTTCGLDEVDTILGSYFEGILNKFR